MTATGCQCELAETCQRRPDLRLTPMRLEKCQTNRAIFDALDREAGLIADDPPRQRQAATGATRAKPKGKRGGCGSPTRNCGKSKPKAAGFGRRLVNVAGAAVSFMSDKFGMVDAETQAARLAVCQPCMWLDGETCANCGCHLTGSLGKAAIRSQACPIGLWPGDTPYSGWTPTRVNLLYHVWPKAPHIWRARVAELAQWSRGLFTGAVHVGIATGDGAESPEVVQAFFAEQGIKVDSWVIVPNKRQLREVVTFLPLLDRIASTAADEVTFYCHAKGQGHPHETSPVHPWAAAMAEVCLSSPAEVWAALDRYTLAGAFKRYGQFTTAGNYKWHYSGTFYWLRHSRVFTRHNWRRVDKMFFGAESWPGLLVPESEAACLFHDDVGSIYENGYWDKHVAQELERWRNARRRSLQPT